MKPRHGHTMGARTRTYRIWQSMVKRCTNPKNKRWAHYGGKGVGDYILDIRRLGEDNSAIT